jgi:hypothetical protein
MAKTNIWQKPIFVKIQYLAKAKFWQKQIILILAILAILAPVATMTMTITRVEHNRISAS